MSYTYTDQQANDLSQRLPTPSKTTSANTLLRQLGIDVQHLTVLKRNIGNCTDLTVYDLSPSYELEVDDNACFGPHLSIVKK